MFRFSCGHATDAVRRAHNVISRLDDVSPTTWKFSGQENENDAWRVRGISGSRREGRMDNPELAGGSKGFGVCGSPN